MLGPIFNREFLTVPRRDRHYIARVAYLGTLWMLAITAWLSTVGWTRAPSLGETARFGPLLFQLLTSVELALFLFFAALTAAAAVAQEKDRRTFVLLLLTDLRNSEIVLGKLLGSLLPIYMLLASTVPIWMLLLLLGGVGAHQVVQAVFVVSSTALAGGSLGSMIALWRDRTFQSLALTTLFLVLYLCLVRSLTALPAVAPIAPQTVAELQQRLDPFLALRTAHEGTAVGLAPAYVYAMVMLGWTVLLNGYALLRLRVWNPSGEPIMQREKPEEEAEDDLKSRAAAHAAPGAVRAVGRNPILWRETATRAYGRRPLLVKLAYAVVLTFICYFALAPIVAGDVKRTSPGYAAAYGLFPIAVLSLLLVSAQAATAITSERDTGALDLLLVTDLTPGEFIFGKLGGVIYNTKEYLLPPLLLAGVYAYYGCLATPPRGHPELSGPMNVTSLVCVLVVGLVLLAFAMVLGVHVALRTPNSRLAVVNTLSTIFYLSVGTMICIALILINGRFEYQWGSFVFFLIAGVGGLWYVLNGERPSKALSIAAWVCPFGVFYTVANILVAKPGSAESADPLAPLFVLGGAFGFTIAAMLVPLLSEFDVALGRTSGGAD